MVGLSEADAEKWSPLLEQIRLARAEPQNAIMPASSQYIGPGGARQRQAHLDEVDVEHLVSDYFDGMTVYQLAAKYGCHRATASRCLKAHGVEMRRLPLSVKQIDEAVRLHEAGLSSAKVGKRIGASPKTVIEKLRERGVAIRDAHDRPEKPST
jgi:sensor c-di-GMP phosphodiesterase-like protein